MRAIPTRQQLYERNLANLQSEFGAYIDPNGKAFLRAFAAVSADAQYLQYLDEGNIQKNVWVDLADPVAAGGTLERFGWIKNMFPFPATAGQYVCNIYGNAGIVIPAQTQFKSDDTSLSPGNIFTLDNAYTLIGSGDTVLLREISTGVVGTTATGALLAVGNTLTATQPITGINPQFVTVASIAVSPIDAETIEQYRARVSETYILQPQGGATADYRLWGKRASGVAQVYPYAVSGVSNTVAVYIEAYLADSTDGMGTPTSTILDAVATIMATSNGLKPLGVKPIIVNPVTVNLVAITIPGTDSLTVAQKNLITTALTQAVATIRPFCAGADNALTRNDTISVNSSVAFYTNIATVIAEAIPGVPFGSVSMTIDSVSHDAYNFDLGAIPFIDSITFAS